MRTRLLAAVALACSALVVAAESAAAPPVWAVDAANPGPNRPAAGQSVFDELTGDGVPFPFEELVRRIERAAGCRPATCVTAVLVPLGRSLQRLAAAPDFFSSPRVIAATTSDGDGRLLIKDRVYLGYQEKAGIIEVISYNEEAARFEFQLVRNYRAQARPETVYASRAVCTACHQNHGPIFSRQQWDETNANPAIGARLASDNSARRTQVYGVTIRRGVDLPNAIDDATDRANLFAVVQRIWRDACDSSCRRQAVLAALQYRLSHQRGFDAQPTLMPAFVSQWPNGLAIPNPDLPNRDPLAATSAAAPGHVDVAAAFEALNPRAPIDVWRGDDPLLVSRFVAGLAALIAEADIRELDTALRQRAPNAVRRSYRAQCSASGNRYQCSGDVTLSGTSTTIDRLSIEGKTLTRLQRSNGRVFHDGNIARTASGAAIASIELPPVGKSGIATVKVVDDFAVVRAALEKRDWSETPLTRSRLRQALGLAPLRACCGPYPTAPDDAVEASGVPPQAAAFVAPCAACHRTAERSPPNFLAGDTQRVRTSLAQCAPRMFVRLAMWQTPSAARAKVAMPPPRASHGGTASVQAAPDAPVVALQATVAEWLRAETGQAPDLATMLARGYENLRPCLPPAS